jgi:prepilin-type N-terminal cleavage/methylation domain-containing protein/prepilin-type processing-associated H-X9-DG protein
MMRLRKRIRGFTLIELLVVIAIIALLISILLPSLSRARELSKRLVCQSDIKGIGTSAKIYANDNNEKWMIPPYDAGVLIDDERIMYTEESNGQDPEGPGQVGMDREFPSYSRDPGASTSVSVTRAYWMLVRSGDITPKQFICPSSGDEEDPTENLDFYYDFTNYGNISFGYQVPFGPRDTQPREGMDNRQPISADKGPWYTAPQRVDWETGQNGDVTLEDSPKAWRNFNSPNHGGTGNGEGQNVLFADGHASFERIPAVGIDHDNIYTLMTPEWNTVEGKNRIHGDPPTLVDPNPFPGDDSLEVGAYSSTDSLIYP